MMVSGTIYLKKTLGSEDSTVVRAPISEYFKGLPRTPCYNF